MSNLDLKTLGKRIKDYRQKRSLTQSDIASALQISAQAVSKWERGENAPDIHLLVGLSRLLDVTLDSLLGANSAENHTFPATVFCTSLNGFAERAAELPPREVAELANGVFYPLTEALLRYDGIPVKYVGDGFLGFFTGVAHQERAFDAAIRAKKIMNKSELVIVLNSGEIYLGTIGHPDYSRSDIIGQTVNTAFLAMPWVAKNCRTGIGILSSTAGALMNEGLLRQLTDIVVQGSDEPIMIFEPQLGG